MKVDIENFREIVLSYYRQNRRNLPWRQVEVDGLFDPYKILVSEMMLQQTQVSRVIPKYQEFLKQFPNIETLAGARLGVVLRAWSGLGYNRRAKFLWQSAKIISTSHDYQLPDTSQELMKLPGIGRNTAGAIQAYAFNQPVVFVETNIRTVYIHHFFTGKENVSDKEVIELLMQTLDRENPREFYWALMDYGSYLKTCAGNLSRFSRTYVKQTQFRGSKRQIRGKVVRLLLDRPYDLIHIKQEIRDARLEAVLTDLIQEGIIRVSKGTYGL